MSGTAGEPLYESLGWALLRAPLLSMSSYHQLTASPTGLDDLLADERVRAALGTASDSIAGALGRTSDSGKQARRLRASLLRYAIRMSTRPTPYGLFAGVAVMPFSGTTDATLDDGWRTRARPDLGRLLRLVMDLEARTDIRRRLRLFANPCAYEHSGRIHLLSAEPATARADPMAVSLRATAPVRTVLAAARRPVPYRELFDKVASLPGATPSKAHSLLDVLWEKSVLVTDLRPPPTTADPLTYVVDRLRDVPEAQHEVRRLDKLGQVLRDWEDLSLRSKADGYPEVIRAAAALGGDPARDGRNGSSVQVDLALDVRGGLTDAVLAEAVTAASTLLRLTPWPQGPPALHAYRQAFQDRYSDGEVPLLELLDERTGLGPVSRYSGAPAESPSAVRDRVLRDLAIAAIRDGRTRLELDDDALRRLRTWTGTEGDAPYSLDIALFVLAASREALDAGDFEVMVGPNVGAPAAGCGAGRFAHLLGPAAEAALVDAARRESSLRPDAVWAEVSYLPSRLRLTNVAVRPLVRAAEIAIGTRGVARNDRIIPAHELLVGVRDGRFALRWSRTGREVIPCAGHMLNTASAPAICRFLDELRHDMRPRLSAFDWGPSADFPFLPRVQYGRVILAPAQWRLSPEAWQDLAGDRSVDRFIDAVTTWRQAWHVPRRVHLSMGDHRLLLDLDDADHVGLLHAEAVKGSNGQAVVLQEALPGPEHAWLPGPGGPRVAEIVVPLIRRLGDPPRLGEARTWQAVSATDRVRPVGSEWLYLKLYGSRDGAEDLLTRHVLPFSEFAVHAGLAATWYFIRYSDPGPHLRLRFRGEPSTVLRRLLPEVVTWANDLLADGQVDRWCFDDYDREIERYGGPAGIGIAEDVAAVDSTAVAQLLALSPPPVERLVLAVLAMDDLLAAMGLDVGQRRHWCASSEGVRRSSGTEYRRLRGLLRALVQDRSQLMPLPNGAPAIGILNARRAALEDLRAEYTPAVSSKPIEQVLRSYVHMHGNRLLGTGPGESVAIGLLERVLGDAARHGGALQPFTTSRYRE